MFKKLKQNLNFNISFFKPALIFIIGIAFFGFFYTQPAKADNVNAKDISFQIDVSDNFFRIDKDGTVNFTAKLTLLKPAQISLGYHGDSLTRGGSGDVMTSINVGLVEKTQNDTLCQNVTSLFGSFVGSTVYQCNFGYVSPDLWPKTLSDLSSSLLNGYPLKQGQVLTFNISLTSAVRQQLGANDSSPTGVLKEIYVYPFFSTLGINTSPAFSPAKSVYVQVFDSTASLAAHQNDPKPVDANGSLTSSPNQNAGNSSPILDLVNKIIGALLGLIQEIIYAVFFWLIAPIIQAMLSIHPYTDTFVSVIYPGWEVIRNLCNIFFIMALMIIAMATLFRVESYKFKDLIIQLIIAALTVNFSLVIAQAVLGLADTVQAQFLPANVTVIRSLAADLMVNNYRSAVYQSGFGSQGTFAATVQPIFYLALSIGSFLVFTTVAAFLFIRVVMLWLLLMVSPAAYASGVLPATAKYRGQWWDLFLKYAFFTPIMAFFINMAAIISNASKQIPVLQTVGGDALLKDVGASDVAAFVLKVGSNILLLAFLLAALKVSEEAGIIGAAGITKFAKDGMKYPFGVVGGAAGFGAKAAGGYLNRRKREITSGWGPQKDDSHKKNPWYKKAAFAALNPDVIASAFKKDSEAKRHTAEHIAEAAGLDFKRQLPGFKEKNLPSEYLHAKMHAVDDRMKEVEFNGDEKLTVQAALASAKLARGGDEKNSREFLRHLFQLTEKSKGLNATMEAYEEDKDLNPERKKYEYTPEGINAFLADLANKGVFSVALAGDVRQRLSKIGYATDQTVLYEGINHHHGDVDPILFETEQLKINGKERWVIKGKKIYETAMKEADEATDQAIATDEDTKKEFKEFITKDGIEVTDPKELEILTEDFRRKIFAKEKKKVIRKYEHSEDHKLAHAFENYNSWQNSMGQKNSNILKEKNANNVFTQTHWNSIASEVDGGYELQDATLVQLQSIDQGTFFGLGRGQVQEKVLDTVRDALRSPKRVEDARVEYLKKRDFDKGIKLKDENHYKREAIEFRVLMEAATFAKKLGMGGAVNKAAASLKTAFSEDSLKKSLLTPGKKLEELNASEVANLEDRVKAMRKEMFELDEQGEIKTFENGEIKFNDDHKWLNSPDAKPKQNA